MDQQLQPVAPAAAPSAPMQIGKSRDPFKVWTIIFALLFVAAAGFAGWQYLQMGTTNSKVASLEESAAALQAKKVELQAELDALKNSGSTGTDTSGGNSADATAILAVTDAYVRAPVAATGEFTYTVSKNENSFAKVNVAVAEGGGYILWLKKVGNTWTVLFGGQDAPMQETLDKYGIPGGF